MPVVTRSQIPEAWAKAPGGGQRRSSAHLSEASAHVFKLEVDTYREDLLDIEDLIRSGIAKDNPDSIRDAVQELVALNDEWVSRQMDAARVMSEKEDAAGLHTEWGRGLRAG